MGNSQSSGGGGKSSGVSSGDGEKNNYNSNYLNSSNLPLVTIKPETKNSSGYSEWNNSTSNSGYSGGISYSSQEQHIQSVNTALGGNVLGGAYNDQRQKRDMNDGINYQVKGIVANLNYYGFKGQKGIVLSDCALEDRDIHSLVCGIQSYKLNLTLLDLSVNKLGYSSLEAIFYALRADGPYPTSIQSINLSNNLLDDNSANYIAKSLEYGRFPSLKYLDVSGNNITATGHLFFAKALEHPNTPNILINLKTTIQNVGEKANKALKETFDFVSILLKYTIEQHVKNSQGTKWDINKVRTNQEIDKWQGCKDMVSTVVLSYAGGVIKHLDQKQYAFIAAIPDAVTGFLDPDTLHCIAEINKSLEDVSLTGDCTIF